MDLRHLRYFVAVAEEGHVTRAAERLGIQQPPLSQQIQALERELDVQLFRRRARGVDLTDAGRALLADARRILDDVEKARARARRTAEGEVGRIAIGFTSSAPFHPFVPRALRAFRESHPQVSVTLEESGTADLVAALRAERLDAAFIRSPIPEGDGVSVHDVLIEPMVAALPKNHPLAKGRKTPALALTDLAAESFVLYRRASGPGLYDAIVGACHGAGFLPRVEQEAPRIVATLNLVASGLGVSIVPQSLAAMRLEGVRFRPLDGAPPLKAPLRLACRTVDHSAAARRFVALVRGAARRGSSAPYKLRKIHRVETPPPPVYPWRQGDPMAKLRIHRIPARQDNYLWLVHEPDTDTVAIVDPADAEPVIAKCEELGLTLTHILNTHHHGDHIGGNLPLKEKYDCVIIGPRADEDRIPGIDVAVDEGDTVALGTETARVFDVPGHTRGHIAYWFANSDALFCGDTLFALGCGRLFEGTPAQMWDSLSKFEDLPDETRVYCAHEYTQANARFALTVDPGNKALKKRAARIDKLRAENTPTVPSTLGEERATNPFLRADDPDFQAAMGLAGKDPVAVFAETRRRKDNF